MRKPLFVALVALSACASRPGIWNDPAAASIQAYGLQTAVVVIDEPAHRLITLSGRVDQDLAIESFPVGHSVLFAKTSPDAARLFVLSAGDVPRRTQKDELPSLSVVEASAATTGPHVTKYTLAAPHGNLAIDPLGRYAAAFAAKTGQTSFVENPNEIVLFDLTQPPSDTNPIARTIRSFGGKPQRLTFTPVLQLPGGARRLLVIETEQDVALLDLDHAADQPPRPEITVRLTNGGDARQVSPAGIAVDDGDVVRTDDSRIAVRTSNDTSVITLQLAASAAGAPNDFEPKVNLSDVGGIPSDIAFVRTDGGLRVAALVPSTGTAALIHPDTSVTQLINLPASYARLSLVTNVGGASAGTDVALLWNASGSSSGVALWTLGQTAGQPYRSVEVLGLNDAIASVDDVPMPHPELKLLETSSQSGFYVLNLTTRTAAPLTTLGKATIMVSPDGGRLWTYQVGTSELASVDFAALHPVPLFVDRPIAGVFDISRADGGRTLIALHAQGGVGATVFDALTPDTATARIYSGLLLEGL
ncbi:MAG: hypothetical protein ABIP39_05315 [Polyangiaceae bacterium]